MCKYTGKFAFSAAVLMVFAFAASVQADTILFKDTFDNAPAGADNGLNDGLADRLSGTLATGPTGMIATGTAWGRDATSVGNAQVKVNNATYPGVMMGQRNGGSSSYGTAIIQHNFNTDDIAAGSRFDLSFCVNPQGTSATNGAVVALGINSANASEWSTTTSALFPASIDFALYIRSNGNLGIRSFGTDIGLNSGYLAGYSGTGWNTFKLHVETTSFAAGSGQATATLYYGAGKDATTLNQIALTTSGANNTGLSTSNGIPYGAFTWTWDNGSNYIGFSQYVNSSGVTQYDNVQVTANIPEPSTLALLATGLFGLLAYAWRKRK